MRRRLVLLTAALSVSGLTVGALATTSSGRVGPALSTTGNGRHLTPAGRMTTVGDFPSGAALSPGGTSLWAIDSGHGKDDVQIVDVATGKVRQVLPLPGAYGAVAFAPDGRSAYVSGEPLGDSKPTGKVLAPKGDAIHVFRISASGHATETTPITLPATKGGTAQQEASNPAGGILYTPPGPGPSSGLGWPIGLAVTPDARNVVVALNQADQIAICDLKTHVIRLVKVGAYPYGVAATKDTAWVTNEYDGTVSTVNLHSGKVTATTDVGGKNAHPEGVVLAGHALYIAITNRDRLVRMSTASGRVLQTYGVGRYSLPGTAPVAVAVRGGRLYAADSGEDCLTVISLVTGKIIGRIPTAAYPTAVAITPNNRQLVWTAAKGLGDGPNPGYGQHFAHSDAAPYGTYGPDMLLGRVGVLPVPSVTQLNALSLEESAQLRPADLTRAPANTVISSPGGGPSAQIKHVFYVVRENRTYDQVFGRDTRGDGDPKLELFGDNGTAGPSGGITPNAHALSRRFPLLDHFYANSEVSVDGHQITAGGYATDFVQRALHPSYSGRGRIANIGSDPVTLPPNDYLFDQAARQGISFENYGEENAGNLPAADDGRSTFTQVGAHTDYEYPMFFGCDGLTDPTPANRAVDCDTDAGTVGAAGSAKVATSRFDFFQAKLTSQIASSSVPALTYLTLPNDHTNGVKKGYPTPSALVADNDLALGQVVQLISHSSIWSSSAIIVVEDDSQDGADHVDAHRMPAFVISPWAKPGAVVHTRYDQDSALRTIELMVGLKPLSLFDGLAEPMYDAFLPSTSKPDLAPYTAIDPTYSHDAVSATTPAGIEGELPYTVPDLVPQPLFDADLWHSVYGFSSTPPSPGPDGSYLEGLRAQGVTRAFKDGLDPTLWLKNDPYGIDP